MINDEVSDYLPCRLVGKALIRGFGMNEGVYHTIATCEQKPSKAKFISEFVHRTLCGRAGVCVFKAVLI